MAALFSDKISVLDSMSVSKVDEHQGISREDKLTTRAVRAVGCPGVLHKERKEKESELLVIVIVIVMCMYVYSIHIWICAYICIYV